ncbi:MAG: hypothetical protein WBX01_13630, partial [Nitrososphaeraceae archaeon]
MNEIESLSNDLIVYDIVNQQEVHVGGTEGWKLDYIISMLGFQTGYGLEIYAVRNDSAYNLRKKPMRYLLQAAKERRRH